MRAISILKENRRQEPENKSICPACICVAIYVDPYNRMIRIAQKSPQKVHFRFPSNGFGIIKPKNLLNSITSFIIIHVNHTGQILEIPLFAARYSKFIHAKLDVHGSITSNLGRAIKSSAAALYQGKFANKDVISFFFLFLSHPQISET